MDFNSIGTVISIFLGFFGIYLMFRSRHPGRISFVNEQTIELFDAVGSSVDKLKLTYDGLNVDENLVLLNGAFINSGRIDIKKSMIEQPITLKLTGNCKWLSGSIIKSQPQAEIHVEDESTIFIQSGLFRCGECIKFHALVKLPELHDDKSSTKRLHSNLMFQHRIADTRGIDKVRVEYADSNSKKLKSNLISVLLPMIVLCGSFFVNVFTGEEIIDYKDKVNIFFMTSILVLLGLSTTMSIYAYLRNKKLLKILEVVNTDS